MKSNSPEDIRKFFAHSDWLDRMVLRPLSHITDNWETSWDPLTRRYQPEPFSFANDLNQAINHIATCVRPLRYHHHEDITAERLLTEKSWPIQKKGGRWIGADYASILEQGAFRDLYQKDLISAAAGRVHAALDRGQEHVDIMEEGHLRMLAGLLTIIIYHRYCDGTSLLTETE